MRGCDAPHVHRLARLEQHRLLRRRMRLDQIDQLLAVGLAVDHRRRVFRLRRDERDGGGRALARSRRSRSPSGRRYGCVASSVSGTKKRTRMFCGGSSETTGSAGIDGLAGARIGVGHQCGRPARRHDAGRAATPPAPVRRAPAPPWRAARRSRIARPVGERICSSFAFAASARAMADARSARCWSTVWRLAAPVRSSSSLRARSLAMRSLVATRSARSARAWAISVSRLAVCRLASRASRFRQLAGGGIACRDVIRIVLGEQRRAGRHLIAAGDGDADDASGERWRHADILGVGVALPGCGVRRAAQPPPSGRTGAGGDATTASMVRFIMAGRARARAAAHRYAPRRQRADRR